jgi:hypothetical protein
MNKKRKKSAKLDDLTLLHVVSDMIRVELNRLRHVVLVSEREDFLRPTAYLVMLYLYNVTE